MQQFCAKVASIVGVIATLKFSAAVHLQCAAAKRWRGNGGSIGGFQLLATVVFVALVAFRLFFCQIEQAGRNAQPDRGRRSKRKVFSFIFSCFSSLAALKRTKSLSASVRKSRFSARRKLTTMRAALRCAPFRLQQQLDNNMLTS